MADPRDSTSPFGVLDFLSWDDEKHGSHYHGAQFQKSFSLMREAGVGFVRFDFPWDDIEPAPGRFVFDKYDRIVNAALKHDIKVLGLLVYNPAWSGQAWNHAPDPMAYARFAQRVVDHFKDRIRHWQLWHEPDNPAFWQHQDKMQGYTALLKQTYPLLKAADPSCIIHLAGMSRSLPGGLKSVYENGGQPFFDVIAIHPFANPLMPGALEALHHLYQTVRRVVEQNGDTEKPIWLTEIGCPGMRDPRAAPNWWLGKNPDETVQAEWVKTIYTGALEWAGVEKIFWCFFRDTKDHFKSGSDYDGLIRHDFSKKPSFEAYRNLTSSFIKR